MQLEEERKARFAELARRNAEEQRKRDEEELRKKEREKRKKKNDDYDPDRMPLWKKGVIAAAACLVLWLCGTWAMTLYADFQARSPVTLVSLCKDFAANPELAKKKYEGGTFQLTGKAKLVNSATETRLVLETEQVPAWTVHCRFEMTAKMYKALISDSIKPGDEVTVVGRCNYNPKEAKSIIFFEECEIRKGL